MAIDDNTSYELTGAQVKDLASKVKASDPLIIYTSAAIGYAFQTYSDDNLTVVITGAQIGAAFKAGRQIILTTDTITEPIATIVAFTEGPEDMFTCVVDNTTYRYGYKSAQSRWVPVSRTVNDGTLTIQHNGTDVQTFTANQSTNVTANIETIWADTIAPATSVAPITGDMLDFTSAAGSAVIKTVSDMSGTRNAIYYADGTLITHRVVTGVIAVTTALGSLYYGDVPVNDYYALVPSGADDFISKPTVSVTATGSSTQYLWLAFSENSEPQKTSNTGNKWGFKAGAFRIMRATTNNNCNYALNIIAVGRWK